ncbi:MAG: hypothetical protein COA73_10780 [Candidatus Hydrogenedentota bacterium]|nr:MAG: hypothetical protein COA73_10780 [Candidatus Hydrogenedentota bacterium]
MPTDTLTRRLGRIEFFATIPAGLLIFYFLYTAIYMLSWFRYGPGDTVTLDLLIPVGEESSHLALVIANQVLLDYLTQNPAAIVLLLFIAYIIGSIVRSLPVSKVDEAIPNITGKENKGNFPYPLIIRETVENISNNAQLLGLPHDIQLPNVEDIDDKALMDIFSFWKDDLRVNAPDVYTHYEAFEARSRFFAGMIIAGFVGCGAFGGALGGAMFLAFYKGADIAFSPFIITMFLPILISLTYSLQIRRIRKQEVKELLMLYILQQKNRVDAASQPTHP